MLSDDKTVALESFLGGLPKAAAQRLARTVELDALNQGTLPHEAILSLLRPALRDGAGAARTPSPLRAFCRPFEDLLFSGPRKEKRRGCVARASILPVWNWLKRELIPDAVADFSGDYVSFVLAGENDSAEQCVRGFWQLAGEAITDAFAIDPDRVGAALGGDFLAGDAEEMGLLLTAGPLMAEVQALLEKPVRTVDEATAEAFRPLHERALVEAPDVAPYLPVAAMGRLEKPWQALRLAATRRNRHPRSAADMGLVGEILFDRMEDARAAIHAFHPEDFDPEALIGALTDFSLLSNAVAAEIDVLYSGRWGKRLLADRAAVCGVMESYLSRSNREIAAVLPLKRCSAGRHALVPDFDVEIDKAKVATAVHYARLLAGSGYLASATACSARHKDACAAAVDLIRFNAEAIAGELSDPAPQRRARIEARFATVSTLAEIMIGKPQPGRRRLPDVA